MTDRIPFNEQDKQILHRLDPGFIIDDNNETATLSGPLTIMIERVADDRLQLIVEFANLEFPILMSRNQTLRQLDIKSES